MNKVNPLWIRIRHSSLCLWDRLMNIPATLKSVCASTTKSVGIECCGNRITKKQWELQILKDNIEEE